MPSWQLKAIVRIVRVALTLLEFSECNAAAMAKDLTTTVFEPIEPEGLALALMVTTIVFTVLSTIVVALRFYARISLGLFSIEDWLMLAGWVSK